MEDSRYASVRIMATKNPAAVALVKMRWAKMTPEERSEAARSAAEARWEGHDAKRPASSRNTGRPVGRPRKATDESPLVKPRLKSRMAKSKK